MLEFFFIDNIFLVDVFFNGQAAYIWVNLCSSSRRLVPLFADFIQGFLKKDEKKLARSFNFTFRYIDDAFSLNNSTFGDCVDHIYSIDLEINDTIDTDRFASYLDIHLKIYSEGWLRTKLYDKRDNFNFPIYLSADTIFQSLWFLSGFH